MKTDLELQKEAPVLFNLLTHAQKHDVFAAFKKAETGELYFVVMPDVRYLNALNEPGVFQDLIEYDNQMSGNRLCPMYQLYRMAEVTPESLFEMHNTMCRMIEDEDVIIHSFSEFGYSLPRELDRAGVSNLHHFINRMNNPLYDDGVRESYHEALKHCVSELHERYQRNGFYELPGVDVRPAKDKHTVDKDYFFRNSIACVNESVSMTFFKYLQEQTKDTDFCYYFEKKPWRVDKDISKGVKGLPNLWKQMTGETYHNISFPQYQAPIYFSVELRYNCRMFENQVDLYSLAPDVQKDCVVRLVDYRDMGNIDSLCGANNVKYAINYGQISPVQAEDTRTIQVIINEKDSGMFQAITERLMTERKGYYPCLNQAMLAAADKNEPLYRNYWDKEESKRQDYERQKPHRRGSEESYSRPRPEIKDMWIDR